MKRVLKFILKNLASAGPREEPSRLRPNAFSGRSGCREQKRLGERDDTAPIPHPNLHAFFICFFELVSRYN